MHKQFLLALTTLIVMAGAAGVWMLQKSTAEKRLPAASPVERCMNLSGALEAPEEGLWGYTIVEEDLKTIRAAGFDTVRLPVRWKIVETPEGLQPDPAQLARVDTVLQQAWASGLNVILNVHHYTALNEDPDTHEPRLETLWQALAQHYADAPDTLIFELINEPHSGITISRMDALNRRLLAIIRSTHPDRWVLYGTAHWGTLEGMLKSNPPYDPKAMIGFHYYEPFEFTHQGAFFVEPSPPPTGVRWGSEKDRIKIADDFQDAARFRDRRAMPLLLGEFGVYEEVPMDLRADWTGFVRAEAEFAGFGWCHWGFGTTFKAYDQAEGDWIYPLLRALIP